MFENYKSRANLYCILGVLICIFMLSHHFLGMVFLLGLLIIIDLSATDNLSDEIGTVLLLSIIMLIGGLFICFKKEVLGFLLAVVPLLIYWLMVDNNSIKGFPYFGSSSKANYYTTSNKKTISEKDAMSKKQYQENITTEQDLSPMHETKKKKYDDTDPTLD